MAKFNLFAGQSRWLMLSLLMLGLSLGVNVIAPRPAQTEKLVIRLNNPDQIRLIGKQGQAAIPLAVRERVQALCSNGQVRWAAIRQISFDSSGEPEDQERYGCGDFPQVSPFSYSDKFLVGECQNRQNTISCPIVSSKLAGYLEVNFTESPEKGLVQASRNLISQKLN